MFSAFTKFYPICLEVKNLICIHIQIEESVTLNWFCDFSFPYSMFSLTAFWTQAWKRGVVCITYSKYLFSSVIASHVSQNNEGKATQNQKPNI